MNFFDTWQELEEIYSADYNATGVEEVQVGSSGFSSGMLYHFYEDLSDLLNSLTTGIIYSTKNDKDENKAQFDFSLDDGDGKAYVCMTNSEAGKRYMIKSYHRPFGLSFDAKQLEEYCLSKGAFIRGYSAFGTKADYTLVKGKPSLLAQTPERGTNPFIIYAVGELLDGTYFVSGGQGMNKLWASQVFYDKQLYEELRDWFLKNLETGEEYQKRMFYHFKDGRVHSNPAKPKLIDADGKPIEADLNLNKYYKARRDFKKGTEAASYKSSICFNFNGIYASKFKEVLGYGPINVVDDNGTVLLKLTAVNPNAKNGYRGPFIFGKNVTTGTFNTKTDTFVGRSYSTTASGEEEKTKSNQQHLLASEELFKKLCQVYNEYEYRIYLPNSSDFRFAPIDVQTLVLPECFEIKASKETINLVRLRDCLLEGTIDQSREGLEAAGIIAKKTKKAEFTPRCLDLARALIKLLTTQYQDVGVELIPNTSSDSQATFTHLLQTGEASKANEIPRNAKGKVLTGDKTRKVIQSWPDLKTAHEVPGQNNEQTIVATVDIPTVGPAEARLGAEVILIAEDEAHNKYVLFVYKSKSTTFMELPGGGFMLKPTTDLDFDNLILDRLNFKCNIKSSDIINLTDTGSSLVLHELGVAKDDAVLWEWSYYRLYTAKYKHLLTAEHLAALGYSYDNDEEAKRIAAELGIPVNSYRAHMRWVPVDSIELNRAITDRYSDIIPLIKAEACRC
jgi:hypothetical protein